MNAISAWNAPEPEVPWPLIITGMFFNNLYWWCTNQSFVTAFARCKEPKGRSEGRNLLGFLGVMSTLYSYYRGYHRILSAVHSGQAGVAGSSGIDLHIRRSFFSRNRSEAGIGFFASVMFGAILSSFNSVLNSASTMFTLDLYRSAGYNPKASDVHCVKVGKIYG